jgi:hypothetical protein
MQARPRLLRACRSIQPPNSRALYNGYKVDYIGGRKGCSAERCFLGLRKCRQTVRAASEQQMPLEKRPVEDPSVEANDLELETESNPRGGNPNNLLQRIAFSLTGRHNWCCVVDQFLIPCVVSCSIMCLLISSFLALDLAQYSRILCGAISGPFYNIGCFASFCFCSLD